MSVIRILLGGLLAVCAALFGSMTTQAYSNDPKTFISGDNVFYAYVESGEKVAVAFSKSPQPEPSGILAKPITVSVEAPGLATQTCVIPANVPVGSGCTLDQAAVKNGIWKINFQMPPDAHVHSEVASSVKWNGNLFNWNITVSDSAGTEKRGRLWSELYAIRQPAPTAFLTDLQFHYISEDGYLYRVKYQGYNGQLSTLSADAFGIVKRNTCETAYQSIATNNTEMIPSFGNCGGSYKLFFEQPSDDLPEDAKRWDDKTDWVRPNIDRPEVEKLQFTPDQATDKQSGTISFNLKNFVGQYEVRIDTNGDSDYNGPDDITLKRQIKSKSGGMQSIKFDGMNKSDEIIPRDQKIGIKISIVKTGEIHLVGADIEGRQGGIEIVRLSGDNVPSGAVCWDDTELGASNDGAGSILDLDGTQCPDSTGGVHKWNYNEHGASWGNARYIDDWVFTSAKVKGTAEITYPTSLTEAAAVATKNGISGIIALVVAVGALIASVLIALKIRKRRQLKKDQQSLQLQQPQEQFGQPEPPQFPPSNQPPTR